MVIDNFKICFIEDRELNEDMIREIIKIKQHHWNYSYDEHKKWIRENINHDEHHLIVMNSNNQAIAYLNIIKTSIIYNNIEEEVLGVGNVCVDKNYSGKGIGKLIMDICNYYLSSCGKRSILLCKQDLVKFYEKSGWNKYEGELYINDTKCNVELMLSDNVISPQVTVTRNF